MPLAAGNRYQLSKDLPKPLAASMLAAFTLSLVSFGVSWILEDTMDRWARRLPAAGYQYPIHGAGSVTFYLSPRLGWYLDNSLWLYFAGLGLCFVIPFLAGARWKRVR